MAFNNVEDEAGQWMKEVTKVLKKTDLEMFWLAFSICLCVAIVMRGSILIGLAVLCVLLTVPGRIRELRKQLFG